MYQISRDPAKNQSWKSFNCVFIKPKIEWLTLLSDAYWDEGGNNIGIKWQF